MTMPVDKNDMVRSLLTCPAARACTTQASSRWPELFGAENDVKPVGVADFHMWLSAERNLASSLTPFTHLSNP